MRVIQRETKNLCAASYPKFARIGVRLSGL